MILVVAGRRIDDEHADYKRFPLSAVPRVKAELKAFFETNNIDHLVSSGACGADLLAQEIADELNIDRTMVLPFSPAVFRKTSVTDRPGNWGMLFDRLVGSSLRNLITLEFNAEDPHAYDRTTLEMLDKAQEISSRNNQQEVMVLIVWEGKAKDRNDVTSGLLTEARRRALATKEINTLNEP